MTLLTQACLKLFNKFLEIQAKRGTDQTKLNDVYSPLATLNLTYSGLSER